MNETVKSTPYLSRLHWVIFLKPFLILLIPIAIDFTGIHDQRPFLIFLAIFAAWIIGELVRFIFTTLSIGENNVIYQTGFFVQKTIDIPMHKIESIDITQSLIGSILNYGDIIITGTGGTRQIIKAIEQPLTCRRYIEQLMHDRRD
ncbi:MAG: PH domain-containing protein [Gammaproteobacteria bacterium]|nr:PH domain-containing protein [Gammaproteobacteria bacterium]